MSCRTLFAELTHPSVTSHATVGRRWGYFFTTISILLVLTLPAHAQPIPTSPYAGKAHYVFAVYTPTSQAEATIWRTQDTKLTTHRLINKSDSSEIRLIPAKHTSLRTFVDLGADAGAVQSLNEQASPTLHEILCYDQLLSPSQRQLTESYLAIKYGLTLDQHLPTNYLAQGPDESTYPVWTATNEPIYRHRIIGLAQDTRVNLSRFSGSSVLAPDLMTLSWEEAPAETAYLLLADDDAPTARSLDASTPTLLYLQRRWRVEATGQVPETTLRIDPRQLFARVLPGETLMLVQTGALSTIVPPTRSSLQETVFTRLTFPTDTVSYLQLALRCNDPSLGCSTNTDQSDDDFFTSVQLSPNPAVPGTPLQLRVALTKAAGLVLTVYDVLGRQVSTQPLPANTHHMAEITLPAPGTYSLHLRSRLLNRSAPSHTIKVIAQ
jgi:hypothetical protein